jgi:hypothetical protein
MSKTTSNLLLLGFFLGFIIIGGLSIKDNMPAEKDERVYAELKPFMPYDLEKRIGGFYIVTKMTGEKEKPPATEVMKRLDVLEKEWGISHLKIDGDNLIILDDNKKVLKKIKLNDHLEKKWVKEFFELK